QRLRGRPDQDTSRERCRPRLPGRFHAHPRFDVRPRLAGTADERPSVVAAGVPRTERSTAGARPRRADHRRHGALRRRGGRHRPDRPASCGTGAGDRHRRDAGRPHPRRGAPDLSRGGTTLRRRSHPGLRQEGDRSMKVGRALISVHDKTGVVDLARGLHGLGIEIVSTGGTAKLLRASGLPVREVADVTGFPEMLDGRVKTLHPKLHGGILARRDVPEHLAALDKHGIPAIDLVVVALYPFEATVAKPGVTLDEAIEQIDVGGPAMIRAAAKNHGSVGVVTDPAQYGGVLDEIERTGSLSAETRSRLAREAFARTAQYDRAISDYLPGGPLRLPPRPPSSRRDRAESSIAP